MIACPVAFPIKILGCKNTLCLVCPIGRKGTSGSFGAVKVEMVELLGSEEGAMASGLASGPKSRSRSRSRSPRPIATIYPRRARIRPSHGGYPEGGLAGTSDPFGTPGGNQLATRKACRRSSSNENLSMNGRPYVSRRQREAHAIEEVEFRQREAHAIEDVELLSKSVQDMAAATPSASAQMSKGKPSTQRSSRFVEASTQRSSGLLNSTSQSANTPASVHVPQDGCMGSQAGSTPIPDTSTVDLTANDPADEAAQALTIGWEGTTIGCIPSKGKGRVGKGGKNFSGPKAPPPLPPDQHKGWQGGKGDFGKYGDRSKGSKGSKGKGDKDKKGRDNQSHTYPHHVFGSKGKGDKGKKVGSDHWLQTSAKGSDGKGGKSNGKGQGAVPTFCVGKGKSPTCGQLATTAWQGKSKKAKQVDDCEACLKDFQAQSLWSQSSTPGHLNSEPKEWDKVMCYLDDETCIGPSHLIARSPMFADYAYQPRRGRINPYERELWQSGDWLAKHSEHWHAKEQSGWQSGGKAAGR